MTSLLFKLQKCYFEAQDQRALFLVPVSKAGVPFNHEKSMVLCCVSDTSRSDLSIVELKLPPEEAKKKESWELKQITSIDGGVYQPGDKNSEFRLIFDSSFEYSAASYEEKISFCTNLINLVHQNLPRQKLLVTNFPAALLNPESSVHPKPVEEEEEEYVAITSKETSDLLALMAKCEHAIANADIFMEDLNTELSVLDSANVYSIMANEAHISNLMDLLENSVSQATLLENRLNKYDSFLEHIRDSMDKMEGKTVGIEAVNANNKKLLNSLNGLIQKFDIPYEYREILSEPDFSSPEKLKLAIKASGSLAVALAEEKESDDTHLYKLSAVQDQKKLVIKFRDKFSKSLSRHLNNIFIHLGNDSANLESSGTLKLASRKKIHQELIRYSELVHWLKEMDNKSFLALQSTYRTSLSGLYEKDVRRFIDQARSKISGSTLDLSTSSTGKSKKGGLLGSIGETESIGSEYSLSERERFDDVLETLLQELEIVCRDEQNFGVNFFKMDSILELTDNKAKKKATEEARRMMSEIFPSLENELLGFIAIYEKMDSFFTMQVLVRLGGHVLSAQDTGSFLAISLGSVLVIIKRNFDRIMDAHLRSIGESRVNRKGKCGILSFVSNFENFVVNAELVFKNSDRRSDLDKWYGSLVSEMMNSIVRLSVEHPKTPSHVVQMENFHHLHALLSRLKVSTLESAKKESKLKYNEALKAYVTRYFGRPLERLNVFFEGIQSLVAAGVKESEVGYQIAYSKQELRKVIGHYPGKEVKKGLDNLYKKVERHLCEEENLMQVVWRAMQEEFIAQYKCIEDLILRCYPGAQISMDFNIDDLLDYFSNIARSH